MKILGERVLIKRDPPEEATSGGIFLGFTEQKYKPEGTVVAISENKKPEIEELAVGARVIFSKNAGVPIVVEGQELLLIQERDIYAVIWK